MTLLSQIASTQEPSRPDLVAACLTFFTSGTKKSREAKGFLCLFTFILLVLSVNYLIKTVDWPKLYSEVQGTLPSW